MRTLIAQHWRILHLNTKMRCCYRDSNHDPPECELHVVPLCCIRLMKSLRSFGYCFNLWRHWQSCCLLSVRLQLITCYLTWCERSVKPFIYTLAKAARCLHSRQPIVWLRSDLLSQWSSSRENNLKNISNLKYSISIEGHYIVCLNFNMYTYMELGQFSTWIRSTV